MLEGLNVLVVDDHPVVTRGLRGMLENEPWVSLVVEAATGRSALQQAVLHRIHVAAMDVGLPDQDGIETTRQLLRSCPDIKVIIFSMSDEQSFVSRAIKAGARGYVLKDSEPGVIVDALRSVANGGFVLGPRIGPEILTVIKNQPPTLPQPFDRLSPRELDILTLLGNGNNNIRIARQLGISEKTVRNQLSGVFSKLGVDDRMQAALLARSAGVHT